MEGSPRMIATPQFQPVPSAQPSVSLGKKTIRNYTPKESSNMLREFEDRRNNSVDWRQNPKHQKSGGGEHKKTKPSIERKSSMDRLIDDFHRSLPAPPHHESNSTIATKRHGTMTSQISNWSAASSAASFEFQTVNSKQNSNTNGGSPSLPSVHEELDQPADEQPQGERIPPEGAPAASMSGVSPTNFVQRIEVKSANKTKQSSNRSPQNRSNLPKTVPNSSSNNSKSVVGGSGANSKPERRKSNAKSEEIPLPPPPPPPPVGEDDEVLLPSEAAAAAAAGPDEVDEFSNLRKLISENRIAGLNENPPSWSPPSPPATEKRGRASVERSASSSRRSPSSAGTKPPAPSTPKGAKSTHSAERQPSRKNREAPKPPVQTTANRSNTSTPNSDVKFVSSRQRESLEDLTQMNSKKRSEVKRSSSNHGSRPSGMWNNGSSAHCSNTSSDVIEYIDQLVRIVNLLVLPILKLTFDF